LNASWIECERLRIDNALSPQENPFDELASILRGEVEPVIEQPLQTRFLATDASANTCSMNGQITSRDLFEQLSMLTS
jgi:hypothetical protein